MDYYIEDATHDTATPVDITHDNAALVDITPDNAALVDASRIIYTNTDSITVVTPDIDVKLRGGKYIFEMTKSETDKLSVNQCIETAMKNSIFSFQEGQ